MWTVQAVQYLLKYPSRVWYRGLWPRFKGNCHNYNDYYTVYHEGNVAIELAGTCTHSPPCIKNYITLNFDVLDNFVSCCDCWTSVVCHLLIRTEFVPSQIFSVWVAENYISCCFLVDFWSAIRFCPYLSCWFSHSAGSSRRIANLLWSGMSLGMLLCPVDRVWFCGLSSTVWGWASAISSEFREVSLGWSSKAICTSQVDCVVTWEGKSSWKCKRGEEREAYANARLMRGLCLA